MNLWRLSMPCDVTTSFFIGTASFHIFVSVCETYVLCMPPHTYTHFIHPLLKPQDDWQAWILRYIDRCSLLYQSIYHIEKTEYFVVNRQTISENSIRTPHVCGTYENSSKNRAHTHTHFNKHMHARKHHLLYTVYIYCDYNITIGEKREEDENILFSAYTGFKEGGSFQIKYWCGPPN